MVKLARNFHAVAAKERLVANKFAIATIDRLTRAVRTIGILDFPIALALAAGKRRSGIKNDEGDTINTASDSNNGSNTPNTTGFENKTFNNDMNTSNEGLDQHDDVLYT